MPEQRQAQVSVDGLEEDLHLRSMKGTEALGRPFSYELNLLSTTRDLAFEDVINHEATVALELPNEETRYFHGIICRLVQTGGLGSYSQYVATVVPRLWLLSRHADCRIFQKTEFPTIADVIFSVLDEHGIEFEKRLDLSLYREWEFCVQYRETAFNFASRMMEQEGIYYHFRHEDGVDKPTTTRASSSTPRETRETPRTTSGSGWKSVTPSRRWRRGSRTAGVSPVATSSN